MLLETPLSRRMVMSMALALSCSLGKNVNAAASGGVVSLDYGLASTLLTLGIKPAAIAARADWDQFVVEPAMPDEVADLGTTNEINIEVLARLKPSLILSNPFLAMLRPRLESIAPVKEFVIYASDRKALPASVEATRELASLIGRQAQAEVFLTQADIAFEQCRLRIGKLAAPPVALITLLDERHARIYGGAGLYQGVLDRLGITNAWQEETTFWGFQTIALEELIALPAETYLMIFEPLMPPNILHRLNESPLWSRLPFVRAERISVLPGVLMFGMVREALRFASLITDRLEKIA